MIPILSFSVVWHALAYASLSRRLAPPRVTSVGLGSGDVCLSPLGEDEACQKDDSGGAAVLSQFVAQPEGAGGLPEERPGGQGFTHSKADGESLFGFLTTAFASVVTADELGDDNCCA